MAEQQDVIELIDDVEGDELDTEAVGTEAEAAIADDGEVEFTFGDGAAPAPAESESSSIQALRKAHREAVKQAAELRKLVKPVEVGPEPQIDDFGYDQDAWRVAYRKWEGEVAEAEKVKAKVAEPDSNAVETFNAKHGQYKQTFGSMPYPDKAKCEQAVTEALTDDQQYALVMAADDAAKVVIALGRNPDKLAELSAITNPLKFAGALAKLEEKIQVKPKRIVPAPEKVAEGGGAVAGGSSQKKLDQLHAKARETGDYTSYHEMRRKLAA